MSKSAISSKPLSKPTPSADHAVHGALIGRVIAVDANGDVVVDHPSSTRGADIARVAAACPDAALESTVGRSVVLVFEEADPARPLIVGWLDVSPAHTTSRAVRVDGQTVVVEGSKRLELKCGKSSITLTEDGKILLRGINLLNEATKLNKIRGAAVRIN